MGTFLYDDKTNRLFMRLRNHPPHRIVVDQFPPSYRVVFDHGERHILATPKDYPASSQNSYDEVIRIEFTEMDSPYEFQESDYVIFENPIISRVFILRTVLYFSQETRYKNKEEALSKITDVDRTDPVLAELLTEATGSHEEIVCNPRSEEAAEVDSRFANLVDSGILLEIDQKYLGCFSNCNSFNAGGHIWSREEIQEEVVPYYEFIKVEHNNERPADI